MCVVVVVWFDSGEWAQFVVRMCVGQIADGGGERYKMWKWARFVVMVGRGGMGSMRGSGVARMGVPEKVWWRPEVWWVMRLEPGMGGKVNGNLRYVEAGSKQK